jgi:hypothetical protein
MLDASSDAPSGEEDTPIAPTDQAPPTGKCSDAGAHGFWQHGPTANFDVHITDTQSRSYWNKYLCNRRRRRRTNIFIHAWKCGRTSPLQSTLLMALQGERLRMQRRISHTIFQRNGTNHSPRWCIMFGLEYQLPWYMQIAF